MKATTRLSPSEAHLRKPADGLVSFLVKACSGEIESALRCRVGKGAPLRKLEPDSISHAVPTSTAWTAWARRARARLYPPFKSVRARRAVAKCQFPQRSRHICSPMVQE